MYKLGSLLVLHQNPAEGVKLLRDALRTDPSLSDAHYYLATGLMDLGQDQDAIHEFVLATAADPTSNGAMSAYYKLAQLYRKLHETQNAQAAMQNFLRMRAQSKEQQDSYQAQVVRKRTELPVADPEKIGISDEQGAK
jgi:tetratricopeptide (TPR) repeat protein